MEVKVEGVIEFRNARWAGSGTDRQRGVSTGPGPKALMRICQGSNSMAACLTNCSRPALQTV